MAKIPADQVSRYALLGRRTRATVEQQRLTACSLDHSHEARGPPGEELLAFSIAEFCKRHQLSESFYYKLKKARLAPTEMTVGRRVLISHEAAARWRAECEAAARVSELPPGDAAQTENAGPVEGRRSCSGQSNPPSANGENACKIASQT
jgi:hypothetical protein